MLDKLGVPSVPAFVHREAPLKSEVPFDELPREDKIARLADELARDYGIVVNPDRYKQELASPQQSERVVVSPEEERSELVKAALHIVLTEVAPKDSSRRISDVNIVFPESALIPRGDIYQPSVSSDAQQYANTHHAIIAEVTESVRNDTGNSVAETKQYILVPEIVVDGSGAMLFADESDATDESGHSVKYHTTFKIIEK